MRENINNTWEKPKNDKSQLGVSPMQPVVKSAGADSLTNIGSSTPAAQLNKGGIKINGR